MDCKCFIIVNFTITIFVEQYKAQIFAFDFANLCDFSKTCKCIVIPDWWLNNIREGILKQRYQVFLCTTSTGWKHTGIALLQMSHFVCIILFFIEPPPPHPQALLNMFIVDKDE